VISAYAIIRFVKSDEGTGENGEASGDSGDIMKYLLLVYVYLRDYSGI